jgi:Copper type II ascorbate-dependent monooxygenase, C-terminal domain
LFLEKQGEHYRNGKVIRTSKAQFYDFEQQGGQIIIQEPYEMKAGDSFRSGCFFRNDDPDRVFGISSTQEMCTNFLMYYPRKTVRGLAFSCGIGAGEDGELGVCASSYERVESLDDIELSFRKYRLFGQPASTCSAAAASAAAPLALQDDKGNVKTETGVEKNDTAALPDLPEQVKVEDVEIPLQNRTPPLSVEEKMENVENVDIPCRNATATISPPPLHEEADNKEVEDQVKSFVQNTTTSTSTTAT